jgi:ribosomal protein L40E
LLGKDASSGLLKNKLLLLTVAILAVTVVLAVVFQPLFILVMGIGLPAACITGIIFFLGYSPPKELPKPVQLGIRAEPAEILADGKSTSTITIQLLDKAGNPISAATDTQVEVSSKKGTLHTSVITIPKGKETEKTVLVSSVEIGPVTVSADANGLKSITMTLNFLEKKRYCMHCGAIMHFTAKLCQKCGKAPPAGVDTKVCRNCSSVVPIVAKFCSECGAGQPN